MTESAILEIFSNYAYQPYLVYGFVILFMTASSFGLPIPEEVTLVSAGLVAYMAQHPALYPPPTPDAEGENLIVLSVICFLAVLGSDLLIYTIGKVYGAKVIETDFFNKHVGQTRFAKINATFNKYSYWACGIFRFTPGVRFPGHMTCGLMRVPVWQFLLVDGLAALISVPTQVILVANYGEVILDKMKEFKLVLFGLIVSVIVFFLIKKAINHYRNKK